MLAKIFYRNALVVILVLCSQMSLVKASEALGRVDVDSFLIEPFFALREGQEVEMSFRHSYLKADWVYKEKTKAVIAFGQKNILGVPSRVAGVEDENDVVGIVEAYGEFRGGYGRIRFGLLPLEFGIESGGRESELSLSPSLLYQARLVARRDFGLSYSFKHNGFYSTFTVHNGEAGKELDNRVWLTGRWGWSRNKALNIGLSATTGETTPTSSAQVSNPSVDTSFDINEEAKWRLANFYIQHAGSRFALDFEAFVGSVVQDVNGTNDIYGGHFDLHYFWSKNVSLSARYGYLEPDRRRTGDSKNQIAFSVSLHNELRTSRVFIEGVGNLDSTSTFKDEILLVWRLTTDSYSRFRRN